MSPPAEIAGFTAARTTQGGRPVVRPGDPAPPPPPLTPPPMAMPAVDTTIVERAPASSAAPARAAAADVTDVRPLPPLESPPAVAREVTAPVPSRETTAAPVPRSRPPSLPARRGVPPALAAVGVVAALVIGFAGGRFSAPGTAPGGTRVEVAAAGAPPAAAENAARPEGSPVEMAVDTLAPTEEPLAPTPEPSPETTNEAVATPTAVAMIPASPVPERTAKPAASATPKATPKATAKALTLADALALQTAGKTDEAIAALEALVKKEPTNGEAHWALATAYRAKRKGPKACPEYRAYAKHAPKGEHVADAKRHLAVCDAVTLLDQEKLDEAYAAFQSIVRANWTFPDGHYWLGTMQALKNENAAACSSFKSYLRLDGKGPYSDRASAQLQALGC